MSKAAKAAAYHRGLGAVAGTYCHGLTGAKAAFVLALFEQDSQGKAAQAAGVPASKASSQAWVWLQLKAVQRAFQMEARRRQRGSDLRVERLRGHLEALAYTNVLDVMGWSGSEDGVPAKMTIRSMEDLTLAQRAAVKSVQLTATGALKIEFYDKLKALELLGRLDGQFREQEDKGMADAAEQIRRNAAYYEAERDKKLPALRGRVYDNEGGGEVEE